MNKGSIFRLLVLPPLGGAGVAQHVWGDGFVDSRAEGDLVQRGAQALGG